MNFTIFYKILTQKLQVTKVSNPVYHQQIVYIYWQFEVRDIEFTRAKRATYLHQMELQGLILAEFDIVPSFLSATNNVPIDT